MNFWIKFQHVNGVKKMLMLSKSIGLIVKHVSKLKIRKKDEVDSNLYKLMWKMRETARKFINKRFILLLLPLFMMNPSNKHYFTLNRQFLKFSSKFLLTNNLFFLKKTFSLSLKVSKITGDLIFKANFIRLTNL